MALANVNPAQTGSWAKLQEHFSELQHIAMQELFAADPARAERFHLQWGDFLLDYSKNRITDTTLQLLLQLADEVKLKEAIQKYFSGDAINVTENRAVLHTALRSSAFEIFVDGKNVIPEIQAVHDRMEVFTNEIISGIRKGYTGKAFTDIVNIGIGGSDLGPDMAVEALQSLCVRRSAHRP